MSPTSVTVRAMRWPNFTLFRRARANGGLSPRLQLEGLSACTSAPERPRMSLSGWILGSCRRLMPEVCGACSQVRTWLPSAEQQPTDAQAPGQIQIARFHIDGHSISLSDRQIKHSVTWFFVLNSARWSGRQFQA